MRTASELQLTPRLMISRMMRTWPEESLCDGWFSPRKFTNPISHWCAVFLARVTHSRLSERLSSLLPLIWLTVSPSAYPETNAIATSRWRYTFCRRVPTLIANWRYPLLPIQGESNLAGLFCDIGLPSLTPSAMRSMVRILPRLETSRRVSHPGAGFHDSTTAFVSSVILSL